MRFLYPRLDQIFGIFCKLPGPSGYGSFKLIEIGQLGGVSEKMLCEFDLDGRDSLKDVFNRQEITRSVCEKKNLDQKVIIEKELEHFSEKKYPLVSFLLRIPM